MFPRITTVLTKLSASKITLEKVGLFVTVSWIITELFNP